MLQCNFDYVRSRWVTVIQCDSYYICFWMSYALCRRRFKHIHINFDIIFND